MSDDAAYLLAGVVLFVLLLVFHTVVDLVVDWVL